ncbi:hypothetical protein T4D_13381 [Trichinella pseudospiralis]|uniref:Uncharacterized protein n=1 Tax=Trichinella pseudospiralis TaxID=6337 RepID=A0A0V1G526_TRIPS|nr:hypothetical protein T4D_13381 [Trichinella pseudospiralis]
MEIQQCYAENIKIWEIEVIVAEMDKIFSFTQDLQRLYELLLNEDDLATKTQEWSTIHRSVMKTQATFQHYKDEII